MTSNPTFLSASAMSVASLAGLGSLGALTYAELPTISASRLRDSLLAAALEAHNAASARSAEVAPSRYSIPNTINLSVSKTRQARSFPENRSAPALY